jgi:hypothetical protein
MRSVVIPDSLYKRLQKHARPFEDQPADVIDRALDALETTEGGGSRGIFVEEVHARDRKLKALTEEEREIHLVSHAGPIPDGTRLRAQYKGKEYLADVVPGAVIWEGQRYKSVSEAAIAVIRSAGTPRTTENGWRFWRYFDEVSGEWRPLSDQYVDRLVQKGMEVNAIILRYIEETGSDMAKPKDLMPFLVKHGAFSKDHREGFPLRKLCRDLHAAGKLSVMTSAHFDQKAKNKSWYFLPPPTAS